jgi:hypothetical protein
MDHEQNCSTSTVRMVCSSGANIYAAVSAGINALWGKLHGGANEAVLNMLMRIHQDGGNVDKYVAMAKDKTSDFRLMGFGHRVYKNFDPRATLLKGAVDRILEEIGDPRPAAGHCEAAGGGRAEGRLLHRPASCTRTLTSTAGSSTGPWASPRRFHGAVRHRAHAGWIAHFLEMRQYPTSHPAPARFTSARRCASTRNSGNAGKDRRPLRAVAWEAFFIAFARGS